METTTNIHELKYPIGSFEKPLDYTKDDLINWTNTIDIFPVKLNELASDLSDVQLSWIYRPEGWNIRQVIHHCADSHMNGLTRFKWTLTEDNPTIKSYLEAKWSELADNLEVSIEHSLKIIEGVHYRWVHLMRSLSDADWNKTFVHPENDVQYQLYQYVALYAWHCDHHLAHINQGLMYEGKF